MRKHAFAVGILTAVALTLGGCAAPSATDDETEAPVAGGEIDFFAVSGQIPIIRTLADQITEYLEGEGYTVVFQDAGFDPVKQAQQIQQAIDTGAIVGAWIFPVAAETLGPSLEALQAAGIPVVLESSHEVFGFDGPQPGIIFDEAAFAEYGTKIGETATECATENDGTEALFLEAPAMASGQDAVHDKILENYTASAAIVDGATAADMASAQTAVSQLLIAHPNADVVIAASDETALGAVGAFKAAGKTPKCIIAGGGGPDVLAAQEAGDVTAVVVIDYSSSAIAASDDLIRLIGDPTLEGSINPTEILVIK